MLNHLFASNKRPYFRQVGPWQTRQFDLSGCQLQITMPPHDFEFPEEDHGNSFNVFDTAIYDYDTEPKDNGIERSHKGVSYPGIFVRKWDTFGPIWSARPLGFLQSSLVVCDTSRMTTSLNCFNPEHFERLILHSLYYSRGPGFSTKIEFKSPVNWQVKRLNDLDFVYFESWLQDPAWVKGEDPYVAAMFTPCLLVPLFEDKYLYFAFSATGSCPVEPSIKLMKERVNQIIASIKLRLSPEAAQQRAAALQQFPDACYSPYREPEAWQYYGSFREGDLYAGEDDIVFEGECSPPPNLNTPINMTEKGR